MAELKTKRNTASVEKFLNGVTDQTKRKDCFTVLEIMRKASKAKPEMWGSSIVGFGKTVLKYENGRELDWFLAGFSPRKQNLVLYIMPGFDRYEALMKKLGKHSTGKSCLYIKTLDDIDLEVLKNLIEQSVQSYSKS